MRSISARSQCYCAFRPCTRWARKRLRSAAIRSRSIFSAGLSFSRRQAGRISPVRVCNLRAAGTDGFARPVRFPRQFHSLAKFAWRPRKRGRRTCGMRAPDATASHQPSRMPADESGAHRPLPPPAMPLRGRSHGAPLHPKLRRDGRAPAPRTAQPRGLPNAHQGSSLSESRDTDGSRSHKGSQRGRAQRAQPFDHALAQASSFTLLSMRTGTSDAPA